MASIVPYTGAPSVGPQLSPTPTIQENTPFAAFGGASAEAVSRLGQVTERSGQELFARGIALQQMHENAEALSAAADYSTQLGAKYENFTSLSGKNAVDNLQPFTEDVNNSRQKIRDGLSSPYAQLVFDQGTRYLQARMVIAAGAHAGQQNKMYLANAGKASMLSNENLAYINPTDDDVFNQNLTTNLNEVNHQAEEGGWSDSQRSLALAQAKSSMWSHRIQGLAKEHPIAAKAMLDEATKQNALFGDDIPGTTDFVRKQLYNTGSRVVADDILAGNGNQFGAGPVPIESAQKAIGGYESHDNYQAIGPKTKTGDYALGRYQVMASNLAPWLKEAGMQPMSQSDFLKNPTAQDQLFKFKFGQYMKEGESFNAAANRWFTGSYTPPADVTDATATTKGHTPGQYLTATNAILARNAPEDQLMAIAAEKAKEISPDDPVFGDYLASRVAQRYSAAATIQAHVELTNRLTLDSAVTKQMQAGQFPTSIEQLAQGDPKILDAFNNLRADDQMKYQKQFIQNAKGNRTPTDADFVAYKGFMGEAFNDPQKFLKEDMVSENLPVSLKSKLIAEQLRIQKGGVADPQMTHALQVLSPTLSSIQLNKTNDPDGYNQFVGSLHDAIQAYAAANGTQPKDKDIQTIGARLLQQQASGGISILGHKFFQSNSPLYAMEPPAEFTKQVTERSQALRGVTPSALDIHRMYIQQEYQKLYGSTNGRIVR